MTFAKTSAAGKVGLYTTLVCLQLVCTAGEDFGQAFSHIKNGNSSDETYIIISFSAFLAFCILSVITTIGYFSMLEDRLMKRYLDEGEVVEAVVVSSEFARGGGSAGCWGAAKSDRMSTEYVLFVEYNRPIADGSYMTKIRKQVKAQEDDITRPHDHVTSFSVDGCEESVPLDCPLEVQRMLQMLHDDENAVKSEGLGRIEMLVMPYFHKSGVSRRQVERSNGYRPRLATLALILSGVGLAAFCVRLAAKAISNSEIEISEKAGDTNVVTLYMSAVFAVLLLLEVILVHFCLRKTFVDALEDEYLKSGDLIPIDEDDSSLSTGSDFFLVKSRQERKRISETPPNDGSLAPAPIPAVVNPTHCRVPATVNL